MQSKPGPRALGATESVTSVSHQVRQSESMPVIPLLGANRLTCIEKPPTPGSDAPTPFLIPGQVAIHDAESADGCVLQWRIVVEDRLDDAGRPLFYDVKVVCPDFEPHAAFVNGNRVNLTTE